MRFSAVVVTRGDVNLWRIIDSYPPDLIADVLVWDNSKREDLSVFGRYAALEEVVTDAVIVQDDDCVLPRESIETLLGAYQPGHIIANMPERFRPHYPDSCLVGFGAVFDRDLPEKAFSRPGLLWRTVAQTDAEIPYIGQEAEAWFHRTCDVVFTALTPRILVDVPIEILDYAYGDDRMYREPRHVGERKQMLDLVRRVRDV